MRKNKSQKINDNFKYLINNSKNWFKGVSILRELATYSDALKEDFDHRRSDKSYITYSRGTVVYVDFGLNIGDELCGPHYAIVLNKKDNPKNAKLTVIPLTSKPGKFNIPLPDGINRIFSAWYALSGLEHNKSFPSEQEMVLSLFGVIAEKQERKDGKSQAEIDMMKRLKQFSADNALLHRELDKQMADLKKISYFKIDNVATVSKYRIRKRRHKYDPLGLITIPDNDMDLIDHQVAQHIIDN